MRDVRMYIANEHFVGFGKLLRLLSMQIGNLLNINELSIACKLPYKKCEEYIALLEKMYIIRLVEPYFTNKRKTISKMNKVFFYDLGMRNIIYNSFNEMEFRVDNGALFENYVFLEIWRKRRTAGVVQFFRTQNGVEIDFVAELENGTNAIECKYKRIERAVGFPSLTNFSKEEGIENLIVVNISLFAEANNIKFWPALFVDRL
jgi:predicted AAA+ superfamily ATPase